MEEIEQQIKEHKNNIIKYSNQIKDIKNIEDLKDINMKIKLENNFLSSLLNIKAKMEIQIKDKREEIELANQSNSKSKNKNLTKKDKSKPRNKRSRNSYNKKSVDIVIKINNFNPEIDKAFNYYFQEKEIYSKFTKKSSSKNYIYFECTKKRNGCCGLIRYEKKRKSLIIKNECISKIKHDTITFENFLIDFQNKNTNHYDKNLIKLQKFYVRYLFKTNQANNFENIISIFKNTFNFPIKLTNKQIIYEKHQAFGTINTLSLLDICKKISTDEVNINIKTTDVFYGYKKTNNDIVKREEKIIFITSDLMEKKLKDPNIDNYFADVTYRIIPKRQIGYKLLTITGVDKENGNSYICALILIKYEDEISFKHVFQYLNNMYLFNPHIIHIDYCKALKNALTDKEIFKKPPIIIHCFLHFVQAIVKKMKNLKIIKSRITKYAFEIIKNIELVCFINHEYIKSYIEFLKLKLKDEKEKLLFQYLNKNWFSKDINTYNYYELFENNNLKEVIPHFFATNNIEESLHNKMNQYLPTNRVTNTNFIISLRNVILNYETKKESIIRKDFVTRALIEYSKPIKKKKI